MKRRFVNLVLNLLWMARAFPFWMKFQICSFFPGASQYSYLQRIIKRNKTTEFGLEHGFSKIKCTGDFRSSVPLRDYHQFESRIERIRNGEEQILTIEKPVLLQPTSGTTGKSKLIPFTRSLKHDFYSAILSWLFDTWVQYPSLMSGSMYWVISPAGEKQIDDGGSIKVGFLEDYEYFPDYLSSVFKSLQAVPSSVSHITDMDSYKYITLLFLLKKKDLAFISIWHPSFLSLLLEPLEKWVDQLLRDIESGGLSVSLDKDLKEELTALIQPDKKRADELREIFAENTDDKFIKIWPQLRVISCWCDGTAGMYAEQLRKNFPLVCIQPKGLLATEGIISVSLGKSQGSVLSIISGFYEFLPTGFPEKSPIGVTELKTGERYSVIVTNGNGLYRYRMHDIIEVVGFHHAAPAVRFISKENSYSDLHGEKLNEELVESLIKRCLQNLKIQPEFVLVAPERGRDESFYGLFIKSPSNSSNELTELVKSIETELYGILHYRHCRNLGQLGPMRLFVIDGDSNPYEIYIKELMSRGQNAGTIKPRMFSSICNWSDRFTGGFY